MKTDTPPDKPMRPANRTGGAADKKYPEREKQVSIFKTRKT